MEDFVRIVEAAQSARDEFDKEGISAPSLPQKLNGIIQRVNEIEKNIPGVKPALMEAERLTDEILDVILSLAALDFTKTVRCGYEDSNFNAVAAGLNMLGQELQRSTVSKDYVDNILSSMSDALLVINPDKSLKTVNESALALLGYDRSELQGQNARVLFENEPIFLQGETVELPNDTSEKQADVVFLTKGNKPIPMQVKGSVLVDSSGATAGVVIVARDMREIYRLLASVEAANLRLSDANSSLENEVQQRKVAEEKLQHAHDNLEKQVQERTADLSRANKLLNLEIEERKRAEAETRAREKKYRDIFENTSVAVWEADVTKALALINSGEPEEVKEAVSAIRIVDVNSATLSLFEAPTKDDMLREFPNNLLQSAQQKFGEALASFSGGSELFEGEAEFLTHTGKKKTLHLLISLQHKLEDNSDTTLINLIDISRQRELEDQLRQSQKMEAIGRLAGGVAHDFNNLLTVILNYGQMLVDEMPATDAKHKKVEQIVECAERAAALTQQLLAFSRKQVVALKTIDLNQSISRLDKMLRRLVGEDIELINNLDPNIGLVKGDTSQIEQIILNLAVNARDAMPKGGKLLIETTNVDVDETYAHYHPSVDAGNYAVVTITDTGEGMPEHVKTKIFEPFFTTKGLGKGTGLGLSTVYGNVKQSAGHIWVYSELGIGTTFKLFFPRIDDKKDARPAPVIAIGNHKGKTILVVDDEKQIKDLAGSLLREQGFNVFEAGNGEEALRLLEKIQKPIDLLLSDVVMPNMHGPVLAAKMAETKPNLNVLFMSGYSEKAIAQNGILMPGAHLLQKPFTQKSLLEAVNQRLDKDSPKTA